MPEELEAALKDFVEYYNHQRYPFSIAFFLILDQCSVSKASNSATFSEATCRV
jgi:hypothetical protein